MNNSNGNVFEKFNSLFDRAETLVSKKPDAVIVIDGRCAGGKTSVSSVLAERFGFSIIHMDDFFLPEELRTPERLLSPGGNVHRERFMRCVVRNIANKSDIVYTPFRCHGDKADEIRIKAGSPLVIEGAYSLHPALGRYYDMSVFIGIPESEQLARLRLREGDSALQDFIKKWIPMENFYFSEYDIEERADMRFLV